MKFSSTLLSAVLLATTASAAPLTSNSKAAGRHGKHHRSHPNHIIGHDHPNVSSLIEGNAAFTSNIQYSSNWAGAVYKSPVGSPGARFTSVSAQITVPSVALPANAVAGQSYSASAWVGIDGDTYTNALFQAGINFNVDSNGNPSYSSWYEWWPAYSASFDNEFQISQGDVLQIDIVATSATSGTATITRQADGAQVSQDFTAPSGSVLGGINAEWIVEDFQQDGSQVPLANMGPITFANANAGMSDGASVGPGGAAIIEMLGAGSQVVVSAGVDGNDVYTNYGSP